MRKYMYNGTPIKPVVEIYHDLIPYLGGISEREFYTDSEKCISAWRTANDAVSAYFGDLLRPHAPSAPPLSYGHLVSLGVPLRQPEDAEPNVKSCVNSVEEGIAFLEERRNHHDPRSVRQICLEQRENGSDPRLLSRIRALPGRIKFSNFSKKTEQNPSFLRLKNKRR